MGIDCGPAPTDDRLEWGNSTVSIEHMGSSSYSAEQQSWCIIKYADIQRLSLQKNENVVHVWIGNELVSIHTTRRCEVMERLKQEAMASSDSHREERQ